MEIRPKHMTTETPLRFQAIANYTFSPNRTYLVELERGELCFAKTGRQFELASAPVHATPRTQLGLDEAPSGVKSSKPMVTVMIGILVVIGSISVVVGVFKLGYIIGPAPYVGMIAGLALIVQGLMHLDAGSPLRNMAIAALVAESPADMRNCDLLIFKDGRREGRLARPAGKPLKPYLLCHPHNFAIPIADIRQAVLKRGPRDAKLVLMRNAEKPLNLTIPTGEQLWAALARTFGARFMET
jgi:hypothetical protein